jgi:hypothetical protein
MLEKQPIQHLAIFTPPFLDLILDGKKTIEGRFSKVRCAPFESVEEGDVVLMKKSGGLVQGAFVVAKVETFRNLNSEALKNLETAYSEGLCASADPLYWERRKDCKYATLLHVGKFQRFEKPFPFPKKDRRGWVVLKTPIPDIELGGVE